jgi:hypothetical protein
MWQRAGSFVLPGWGRGAGHPGIPLLRSSHLILALVCSMRSGADAGKSFWAAAGGVWPLVSGIRRCPDGGELPGCGAIRCSRAGLVSLSSEVYSDGSLDDRAQLRLLHAYELLASGTARRLVITRIIALCRRPCCRPAMMQTLNLVLGRRSRRWSIRTMRRWQSPVWPGSAAGAGSRQRSVAPTPRSRRLHLPASRSAARPAGGRDRTPSALLATASPPTGLRVDRLPGLPPPRMDLKA